MYCWYLSILYKLPPTPYGSVILVFRLRSMAMDNVRSLMRFFTTFLQHALTQKIVYTHNLSVKPHPQRERILCWCSGGCWVVCAMLRDAYVHTISVLSQSSSTKVSRKRVVEGSDRWWWWGRSCFAALLRIRFIYPTK